MSETEEEEFRLRPIISQPDKEFRNRVGEQLWQSLKSKAFRDDNFKCKGCGFEPYDVQPDEVLDIHLVEEDKENPANSIVRTTCNPCHLIEHADAAIAKGYVKLVNSHYSQGELVNICRNGNLSEQVKDGNIRYLKKSLPDFLEELKNGKALEGKVKFVFTEKYLRDVLNINPS